MKFDEIDKGIGMISMPERNETGIESDDIISNISQHELTNIIHQEFQKTFIKKLYPNPVWTNRGFWVIVNNIENNNKNIELYEIISGLRKYLLNHNLPIPIIDWSEWVDISDEWKQISNEWVISQRDTAQLIRSTIQELQTDGKAQITAVSRKVIDGGISQDRFEQTIEKMKTEGSIFEPTEGYFKCI